MRAVVGAASAIGVVAIALVSVQRHSAREAASQSVSGELVAYGMSDRTLTLRTQNGDRHLIVPAGTPLHEGAREITLAYLSSAQGCPAKVWYRDVEGKLTASEVRISCVVVSGELPRRRQ